MEGYREAFERAMRLAPYYEQAYYHLLEDAFARLDAERVGELLPGLRRIDPERTCPGIKLAYDLRWGADTTRNRALAGLDSLSVEATTCAFVMIAVAPELMEHTERTQLVGLPGASPVEAGAVFWRLFQARLWNGQPAAVHRLIDERMDIPKFEAANRLVMQLSGYPADSAGLASVVDVLTDTPMLPEDVPSPLAG
jgi:hypothetical protein